ncbi:hypothetical protein ACO0SA_002880 [Hanseniaspora valbyensis]
MKQNNNINKSGFSSSIEHLLNASKIAFSPDNSNKTKTNSIKQDIISQDNKDPTKPENTNTKLLDSKFIITESRKRKRIRKIKSCKFCYRRHIKCDKEKGSTDCSYYRDDEIANISSSSESTEAKKSLVANDNLNAKNNLTKNEKQIDVIFGKSIKRDESILEKVKLEFRPNPLLQTPTIAVKDERMLFFGPTCFRSSMSKIDKDGGTLRRVFQVWNPFKKEKHKFRKDLNFSLAQETKFLDYNSSENHLLKNIVEAIPRTRGDLKYYVSLYFESPIYDMLQILDRDIVFSYIDEVFEVEKGSDKIINITFTNKRNYYKAGIILYILGITLYGTLLPDCIVGFFVFLQGQSTGKMMFFEKVQFLVLKSLFSFINGHNGGDFSHIVNLVGIMANTMVAFQLNNLNVQNIYKNEPSLAHVKDILGGNFKILSRMLYVGMFVDVICSCQNGKPLFISLYLYHDEWLLLKEEPDEYNDVTDCAIINSLKMFLYYTRRLLNELYKPVGVPKINTLLDDLFSYIHNDLMLNEMCYGDNIPENKNELNLCIMKSFLASFALELGISVLAVKRDCQYNDKSEKETDPNFMNFVGNQISYYCLCANQVISYLTKCINTRQLIFEKDNRNTILKEKFKTVGYDKVIFFLYFAPRFCTVVRTFTDYFKVLFCKSMLVSDEQSSYEYMEDLLEKDRMIINNKDIDLKQVYKEENSVGLRDFVKSNDINNHIMKKKQTAENDQEHYYLSKIYHKFHPELFQKGDLNTNLSKIEFTGLQLYGWFIMFHDEQLILDSYMQEQANYFKIQGNNLKTKQSFIRYYFSTFLESLCKQKEKRVSTKSPNLLKKSFEKKSSDTNSSSTLVKSFKDPTLLGFKSPSTTTPSSPINFVMTPTSQSISTEKNFDLIQKGISLNSPTHRLTRSNSNILGSLPGSPMFGWDMNFVDFSSKMNWFMQSPLPQANMDDNEINILTNSIEKSTDTNNNDNKDKDKDKNNSLLYPE